MAEVGGFHENAIFPTDIAFRSRGGGGYQTKIIELDSGAEQRIARWSQARRRYDVSRGIETEDDLGTILEFWHARRGNAYGFKFLDWWDYTTAENHRDDPDDEDEQLGTGDGSETEFQLIKRYTSGGITRTRNLRKPMSGTVVVSVDGVAQTEGVDFTVDTTTGIVTFSAAPAIGEVIKAGCKFYVPVRFNVASEETLYFAHDAHGAGEAEGIELIEILGDAVTDDEFPYGGGDEISLTADTAITPATGRALRVEPDANGHAIILPNGVDLPKGAPYFYLKEVSASFNFVIQYPAGNDLVTVSADSWAIVTLSESGGAKVWTILTP